MLWAASLLRGQEDSLLRGEDGGGHHALGCVSAQGTGGLSASRRGWRGTSCSGLCLCSGDRRTLCFEERMEGDIMLWAVSLLRGQEDSLPRGEDGGGHHALGCVSAQGTGGLSASRRGCRGTSCSGLCLCSGDRRTLCLGERMEGDIMLWDVSLLRGQEDSLPRGEDGGGHHALGCVSAQGTGGLAASRRGWRGTSCSGLCLCSGDRRTLCLEERMEGDIMLWAVSLLRGQEDSASRRGWRGTSCSGLRLCSGDRRTLCIEERMEGDIMLWAVSLLRGQEDSLPRGEDGGGHHALGCVSAQGTGGLAASRRGWRRTSCCGLCLCSGDRRTLCIEERMEGDIMLWAVSLLRGQEDSLPRGEDGGGHHAVGCVSAQGTGGLAASRRGWRRTSCCGLCLCSGDRRTRCLEERMEGDIMLWAVSLLRGQEDSLPRGEDGGGHHALG
ncbi:hypothetical protein KUCAC02_033773 [Chaenocephalus aceratus]|nr:hypothetical protein KUCAC02_033773 [Chaenocephalus aceratus]